MVTKLELSRMLGVDTLTVNRLIVKGLPYTRYGKGTMFDYDKVNKWLKDNKITFKKVDNNQNKNKNKKQHE